MLQPHKDILKLLIPLELQVVSDSDLACEGAALDRLRDRGLQLLEQMFPQTADELIPRWEYLCGLVPGPADPLQLRRERVIAKIRERGGLSVPYFIALAAGRGYDIDIEEKIGGNPFCWSIATAGREDYVFRAGESCAGDYLLWWLADTDFETWLNDLKPAWTRIVYNYVSYLMTEDTYMLITEDGAKIILEPS